MKRFLAILFPLALFSTVNEPLRCELFSGYRNDRLHWHLQEPAEGGALTYSELYRDLQFWENGLSLKVIHRDLTFYLRGSYSAFGRGTLFQRYANLSFTSEQPNFTFSPQGWAVDATGFFGYAVNLTADRTYKVILIPILGYSGHFMRLTRAGGQPDPLTSDQAIGASSFTMRSSLPKPLHQTMYGFFLGGQFQIETGGYFIFQAGYSYHWLHSVFKSHFSNEVSQFDPGPTLLSSTSTDTKIKASRGGNLGHLGWAQIDGCIGKLWRLGVGAEIHYFSTGVLDASLRSQTATGETTSSEKFKLRWTSITGWVQTSRSF